MHVLLRIGWPRCVTYFRGVPRCVTKCDSGRGVKIGPIARRTLPTERNRETDKQRDKGRSRTYFSVQSITICAVVKSKCAVENVMCALRSAEILVKMMIYVPIARPCAVVNAA